MGCTDQFVHDSVRNISFSWTLVHECRFSAPLHTYESETRKREQSFVSYKNSQDSKVQSRLRTTQHSRDAQSYKVNFENVFMSGNRQAPAQEKPILLIYNSLKSTNYCKIPLQTHLPATVGFSKVTLKRLFLFFNDT